MRKKMSLLALFTLILVFAVACGGDKPDDAPKDSEKVESNSSKEEVIETEDEEEKSTEVELSSGEAELIPGEFSKEIKVISGADVNMMYEEGLKAEMDSMNRPSVELGHFYWVSAYRGIATSSMEELTESFENLYTDYKGFKLYESTYKDHPCLVFMIDKDSDKDREASVAIYIYIDDKEWVEISVYSAKEDLDTILNDPLTMAIVNNVSW